MDNQSTLKDTAAQLPAEPTGPYAALKTVNYRNFVLGWFVSTLCLQMMSMTILWEVYERTQDAFALGLIGLFQALPVIAFALPGGQLADIFNRKKLLLIASAVIALCAAALTIASYRHAPIWVFYALVVCAAIAKAFGSPARASMMPLLVAPSVFPNAVTWNSVFFHTAATVGPLLGGTIIHQVKAGWPLYLITCLGTIVFMLSLTGVHPRNQTIAGDKLSLAGMLAGASFVYREKTILAALTLDLMAVLFGGATALLPVYAKDILQVGPIGLGALKAAPYVGAVLMSFALAHLPPFRNAGRSMLLAVAAFGVAMIVFGISRSFWLSLACLLASGMVDNISVVIRHVLVQVRTPDALRGRVSSVNTIFIESSNELGSFESGTVAYFFGPVVSVVSGGIGTIIVVGLIALHWPAIRRLGQLKDINEQVGGALPVTIESDPQDQSSVA